MSEKTTLSRAFLAMMILAAALAGAAGYAAVQRLSPVPGVGRAGMERVVHDYLLAHPEIIPQAMERLQQNASSKAVGENRQAVTTPFAGALAGNPQGDVTVVEFFDYNCGYCRASLPNLQKLIATDPGVRVVFRELPILAPESTDAARMSLAAAEQGKFLPFHDALYAGGQVSAATIQAAAAKAGLDVARANAFSGSQRVSDEIRGNMTLAGKLGVSGTPAWVIGDRVYSGAIPFEDMVKAVKAARQAR